MKSSSRYTVLLQFLLRLFKDQLWNENVMLEFELGLSLFYMLLNLVIFGLSICNKQMPIWESR